MTITWKLPNFNYLLCIRQHASQEIHHTISRGLLGGVALRVVLLSTKFFIAPLPDRRKAFPPLSFSSSWEGVTAAGVGRPWWALCRGVQWSGLWWVAGPCGQAGRQGCLLTPWAAGLFPRGISISSRRGKGEWRGALGKYFPGFLYRKRQICLKYIHMFLERQD